MSASAHDAESRAAVDDVIASRRDIRRGFTMDPIDDAALERILVAAHQAPSRGLSQPWDFLLLRDVEQRQRIQALAARQRDTFAASLPTGRARLFDGIKVEAILVTSLNIVVTCDTGRGVPTPWGDMRILEWLRFRLPWPFRTSVWRRGPRVSGGLGQLLRPRRAGTCAGPAGLSRCGGLPVRGPC